MTETAGDSSSNYLTVIHYSDRHERLLITWTLGTLVIAGPKVLEFYDHDAHEN